VVARHVVMHMSNYDATAVFKNPIIQMTWSFHEIS
jgi:hypothetical protein